MGKRFIAAVFVASVAVLAFGREHPFLFMNSNDIARVRANAQFDKAFERLANIQIQEADKVEVGQLPPFETGWRIEEEEKGYLERDRAVTLEHLRLVPRQYGRAAKDCARAWVLTEDVAYLDKAKEILLRHTEYDFSFEGVNTGLDYAVATMGSMEAYDIAYNRFSPKEHAKMKDFFMRMIEAVKKDDDYWVANNPSGAPMNNHEGMQRMAMAMVGLFYDMPEYVDRAIVDFKGFEDMLRYGFNDDGLWCEGSLPYNYVQLDAMLYMAELAHNAGYPANLFTNAVDDGLTLRQCYDVTLDLVFPDGSLPPVGDGYGNIAYPLKRKDFELLYTRLGDPRHAWMIKKGNRRGMDALFWGTAELSEAEPPSVFSRLWPRHGFAALRSEEGTDYWNGDGYTLFASFGDNPSHSHADHLSINLYAKNHLWLRDSECKASRREQFAAEPNMKLNWTSQSHNSVLIDFKSVPGRMAKGPMDLREYTVSPTTKRITMGDLNGYLFKGVKQLRTCIVRDEYVLDVFQVVAEKPRDISWITHVDAEAADCFESDFEPFDRLPNEEPWNFISAEDISDSGNIFWESFHHEGKHFRMDLFSSQRARYARCRYPLMQDDPSKDIPMRMVTCHGDDAVFVAVYRADDEEITSPVAIEIKEELEGSLMLNLDLDGKQFKHRIMRLD